MASFLQGSNLRKYLDIACDDHPMSIPLTWYPAICVFNHKLILLHERHRIKYSHKAVRI
jgi:hypothetical protein